MRRDFPRQELNVTNMMALSYGGLFALILVIVVVFTGAFAVQNQVKLYRVVLVVAGLPASVPPQIRGLQDGFEELGYVTGKNLRVEMLRREDYNELRTALRKLAHQQIDAIITTSGEETVLAQEATGEIPIIFMPAGDPVRSGFVHSLANPGKNLTGLSFFGDSEDRGKQLQVFKKVVPTLRSVSVVYDMRKESLPAASGLSAIRRVAAHLPARLTEHPVNSVAEAEQVLRVTRTAASNGIFLICGPLFRTFRTIASIALEKKMPLFGCNDSQVSEEGALLTYAPDMYYIGYRAARYVDRVLKGAKPQDLPVETPKKFELVINLKTANKLGLTIPPEILILADKVIQ